MMGIVKNNWKFGRISCYPWKAAVCIALSVGLLASPIHVSAGKSKEQKGSRAEAPEISGEAAVVMEASTGAVIFRKNGKKKHYPASITKIMTAFLAAESCGLEELVTVPPEAVYMEDKGTHIALDAGEQLTVEQCLYAVLLGSANDAAYALAAHAGGTAENFVRRMNEKAEELGCRSTHFTNPHGLPDKEHLTSAYDMALITRAAIENETFREVSGTQYYEIPPWEHQKDLICINNHHKMIRNTPFHNEEVFAGKNGYTDAAGSTLVTCASRDGVELICVILKADGAQIYQDTEKLLEYGFAEYPKEKVEEMKEQCGKIIETAAQAFRARRNLWETAEDRKAQEQGKRNNGDTKGQETLENKNSGEEGQERGILENGNAGEENTENEKKGVEKAGEEGNNRKEAQEPKITETDWSAYFNGLNGAAVLYDASKMQYYIYNQELASIQRSPCSTFKIISSLLALEHGLIDPENSTRPWSGEEFWNEAWNRDISFRDAFRESCVWYFRQVTDDIGQERMQEGVTELRYGNCDISDWEGRLNNNNSNRALTGFWIESSLKISPKEQAEVMERIFGPDSAYSQWAQEELKQVMLTGTQEGAGLQIYGKTGMGMSKGVVVDAWFTGFAKKEGRDLYFCVYLGQTDGEEVSSTAAKEIAIQLVGDEWEP